MADKVCVVTGGTGALGEATATNLARHGCTIVLACRDKHRGQDTRTRIVSSSGNSAIQVQAVDLSSPSSVRDFARRFSAEHGRLDALIHTAAVFTSSRRVTPDGFELMFATNHLGPYLLTNLLLDTLRASAPSRILIVTAPSTTPVNFEDLQGETRFRALWAFGATKMCNLLFAYELARRLQGTGVTANAFHPGLIKSGLMKEAPAPLRWMTNFTSKPASRAAESLAALAIHSAYEAVSGRFFKGEEIIQSNVYSLNPINQSRLWAISASLLNLPTESGFGCT